MCYSVWVQNKNQEWIDVVHYVFGFKELMPIVTELSSRGQKIKITSSDTDEVFYDSDIDSIEDINSILDSQIDYITSLQPSPN